MQDNMEDTDQPRSTDISTRKPKRFVGKKNGNIKRKNGSKKRRNRVPINAIPTEILDNPTLKAAVSQLPSNYNFEIFKTVWRLKTDNAKKVALQFPEGLLIYSCVISDILEQFSGVECIIMGDVTYGACCVDDLTAKALGADFLVHYGHSCLVPIDVTSIKMLYVFVDIGIDVTHVVETVKANFTPETKLAILGTIQFSSSIHAIGTGLKDVFDDIYIPQAKPLSKGEVLGCTAPLLSDREAMVFISDGRFHLESAMIANPHVKAYRYNPYDKALTYEQYETEKMKKIRFGAIHQAKRHANKFGIILGTLGRQGNVFLLQRVQNLLQKHGKESFVLLLSEIFPAKLDLFKDVEAWVQIACPRLSIDWGSAFKVPLLTPYELEVAVDEEQWREIYPMDWYAKEGGRWTNYWKESTSS